MSEYSLREHYNVKLQPQFTATNEYIYSFKNSALLRLCLRMLLSLAMQQYHLLPAHRESCTSSALPVHATFICSATMQSSCLIIGNAAHLLHYLRMLLSPAVQQRSPLA
jgi:hypothetical protein